MLVKNIKPRNLVLGQIFDDFSLSTEIINFNQEDLCSYIINDSNNYYWLNIESVWGPMGFIWDVYNDYGHFSTSNKNYMVLPKVPDGERIKHLNKLIATIPCTNDSKTNLFKILKSNWSKLENLEYIFMSDDDSGNNNLASYIDADFTDSLSEQNDTTRIGLTDRFMYGYLYLKYNGYILPLQVLDSVGIDIVFDNKNIDKLFIGTKSNENIIYSVTNFSIIWNVSDVLDIRRIFKNIIFRINDIDDITLTNNTNKTFILKNFGSRYSDENPIYESYSYNIDSSNYKKEDIINITFIPNNDGIANDLVFPDTGERPFTLNVIYDENITKCFFYKCLCDINNWNDWDNTIIQKMKNPSYSNRHPNYLFHLSTINVTEKNNNIIDLSGTKVDGYINISDNVPFEIYYMSGNQKGEIKLINDIMPKIICNVYNINYSLDTTKKITLDLEFNSVGTRPYLNRIYFKNPITVKDLKDYYCIIKLEEVQQYKITFHITKSSKDDIMTGELPLIILNKTNDFPSNIHIKCINTIIDDDVEFDNLKITYCTYINYYGAIIDHPVYIVRYTRFWNALYLNTIATDYKIIKNVSININRDMDVDEIESFTNAFHEGNGTITIISSTYQKFTAEQITFIVSKGYEVIEKI